NYISKTYEIPISEITEEISNRVKILDKLVNNEVLDLEDFSIYLKKITQGGQVETKAI
ncbi:type II secretion system protein VirB, partial [Sulfolobus islandicus]